MSANRSDRTRVVADLGWLGGLLQIVLGMALLAIPEAPLVAATLAVVTGCGMILAGTLVLWGVPASRMLAGVAFACSSAAAAYAAWVAAPYWRGAAAVGVLALVGLIAMSLRSRPSPGGELRNGPTRA